MELKDLQPYDSLTFRYNRVYLNYVGSVWNTHNQDFTSKKNPKFDIVLVKRGENAIFEDKDYKKFHN